VKRVTVQSIYVSSRMSGLTVSVEFTSFGLFRMYFKTANDTGCGIWVTVSMVMVS